VRFHIITGGGPGVMRRRTKAQPRPAAAEGLNIELPMEQSPNLLEHQVSFRFFVAGCLGFSAFDSSFSPGVWTLDDF
jgi:hypothetical protein